MNIAWFWIVTLIFAIVAVAMILIILVQRPQGGGLVGAFGGAGGTETVFGGRVGDALTYATVTAFVLFLGLAIALNLLDNAAAGPRVQQAAVSSPAGAVPPAPPAESPAAPAGAPATPGR